MCDFAANSTAAEQLLVGRVLTVKRVGELRAFGLSLAHPAPG